MTEVFGRTISPVAHWMWFCYGMISSDRDSNLKLLASLFRGIWRLTKMPSDRIAFLLGSGISRESGAPTVDELTRRVLESPWKEHTDGLFSPVLPGEGVESEALAKNAQHLIRIVDDQIKAHIVAHEGRLPNYEDHYSALKQIVQDETAEILNPLITKNKEAIRNAAASLYLPIIPHIDRNRFASLAERASDLIQCVVFNALRDLGPPKALDLLVSAARTFESTDIFSLNHDLLIETQLEKHDVDYVDGFGAINGDITLFNWSWNDTECRVRLFKLHGSVDWYRFRFQDRGVDQYGKCRSDPDYAVDSKRNRFDPLETIPGFLTGTTVKEQTYGYGLYGELFEQFRHRLKERETLVCSGYGWNDKGINIRINQWLRDNPENRVLLLHGRNGEELKRKRFWTWKWDHYVKTGKVVHIPAWLSECAIDDLQQYL